MASLSRPLPPPLSCNHLPISTTAVAAFCPFFRTNKDPSSTLRRRRFVVNVAPVFCSASNGGRNHSPDKVDRRDILIGLAGLYGASSTLSHNSFGFAVTAESPLGIGAALADEIPSASSVVFPRRLDSTLRVDVPRPKKEKKDVEEILVISGIELDRNKFVKFDVFINDEDDPVSRPDNTEFAGSFVNVPHKHSQNKKVTVLRIGISELLDDLDADDDDSVIVTLVPRAGTDDVTIGGIKIELAI